MMMMTPKKVESCYRHLYKSKIIPANYGLRQLLDVTWTIAFSAAELEEK